MAIKKDVLTYLGVWDSGKSIEEVIKELGVEGKITQRTLTDLIVIICNNLEKMEKDDQPQPSQKSPL